jgi:hypothetical protein
MKQQTFATVNGFEKPHRTTRKAAFLERMEKRVPWSEFCTLILNSSVVRAENNEYIEKH